MKTRVVSPREWGALVASGADVAGMFIADWCGHSQRAIRSLPADRSILLVDLSDAPDGVWDAHSVEVVPTVVRVRGGIVVARAAARMGVGLPRERVDEILAA